MRPALQSPPGDAFARWYAERLLKEVDAPARAMTLPLESRDPDLEWAVSGAMMLTGRAEGPPLLANAPLAAVARAALAALTSVARAAGLDRQGELVRLDAGALLGERAAAFGFARQGSVAPGGSCRLLRCRDGWIALNLARSEDVSLLPAWLGDRPIIEPHAFVAAHVPARTVSDLVTTGRELGLAVAGVESAPEAAPPWRRVAFRSDRRANPRRQSALHGTGSSPTPSLQRPGHGARHAPAASATAIAPLVVDLSALWAGPLAAHLLGLAGARVIKVESTQRGDGARRGSRHFYDLVNGGKRSVALDFRSTEGRRILCALIERADIVIEASRPRALCQLGIDAESIVRSRPGKVWVSITGYGRREPQCNWIAFGDDAGAAAGLVIEEPGETSFELSARVERVAKSTAVSGGASERGTVPGVANPLFARPVFCGDAIADPLTGMHAALAALAAWANGESVLLDVSLRDVAAHAAASGRPRGNANDDTNDNVNDSRSDDGSHPYQNPCGRVVRIAAGASAAADGDAWEVIAGEETQPVLPPRARSAVLRAAESGADTAAVVEELGLAC